MSKQSNKSNGDQEKRVSLADDPDVIGVAFERTSRTGKKYYSVQLKENLDKGTAVVMFATRWGHVLRRSNSGGNFFDQIQKKTD